MNHEKSQALVKTSLYFNNQTFDKFDIVKISTIEGKTIEGRIISLGGDLVCSNVDVQKNDGGFRHIMANRITNCILIKKWEGFNECT